MFLSDNCTENTHLLHEETITLENITNVREMDPNGDIEAFCYFFDHLVPCVAGQKVWTQREKANKLIFEAKKVVSILNKVFTVLALKNYWKIWNSTGTAIWTDSRVGNYQYMGWADAAYIQFDSLCKQTRDRGKRASNMILEQEHLTRSRMQLSGGGPHSRRLMVGQVETDVEVWNKLDSNDYN
jgi:hypothetical protein